MLKITPQASRKSYLVIIISNTYKKNYISDTMIINQLEVPLRKGEVDAL